MLCLIGCVEETFVLLTLQDKSLKTVFSRCEDVAKKQNARDHLAWAIENGDHTHEVCIPHRIPRAWKQQE